MCRIAIGALIAALSASWAAPVRAAILVEDFEDPGGGGGFDPAFKHFLHEVGNPGGPGFWELDGDVLWLFPATDEVAFNLGPGEYVDWSAVTLVDGCGIGCTTVEFFGTLGSALFQNTSVGVAETYDTTGLDLGEITDVVLTSFEGGFDDLTINVVPEPVTLPLLALGGLFVARRRR